MKLLALAALSALASPAYAHPDHLAEQAGHSHWVALAATMMALAVVVIGIARALVRRRKPLND